MMSKSNIGTDIILPETGFKWIWFSLSTIPGSQQGLPMLNG